MARRGRKPEPTVLKLARGNPGKRPIDAESEPQLPPPDESPPPPSADPNDDPAALTGPALQEWNRLRPVLIDAGVLTSGDEFVFHTYCRLVGEVHEFERKCAETKLEDAVKLGYTGHLYRLRNQVKQYAAELGLTPSSRSTVKVAPALRRDRAEKTDENDDKRKKYFGARRGPHPA